MLSKIDLYILSYHILPNNLTKSVKNVKYKPQRDLPKFVREHKTLSPSELVKIILRERNKQITPEAISNWFRRHPKVHYELTQELASNKPNVNEEVLEHIFQNGAFEELPSVKNWILEMEDRDIARISARLGALKRVCMGKFTTRGVDLVAEGLWCFKHPDRLRLDEAREIVRILKRKGLETANIRIPLRDFLLSKGIVVGKKITGAKSKGYGKFAKLYVKIEILREMLQWIKTVDFEAYVVAKFMFKTGTRINATLEARIENMRIFGDHAEIRVFDKARRSIHPEGKEWIKHVDESLLSDLKTLIGDRKSGKIFSHPRSRTQRDYMSKINREALKRFVPELEPKIPMPNHFWRHMFFQHMLRLMDWNYGACAELGGSTVKSVEESYGKPPEAIVRKWGLKYMPKLEVSEETTPIRILEQPFLEV